MINEKRLAETIHWISCGLTVFSREEGRLALLFWQDLLASLGAQTAFDNSAAQTGSDTGNLIARFKVTARHRRLLFSAHMDTSNHGRGISPISKNGRITSDGTTILGADDKSALASPYRNAARVSRNPAGAIPPVGDRILDL